MYVVNITKRESTIKYSKKIYHEKRKTNKYTNTHTKTNIETEFRIFIIMGRQYWIVVDDWDSFDNFLLWFYITRLATALDLNDPRIEEVEHHGLSS